MLVRIWWERGGVGKRGTLVSVWHPSSMAGGITSRPTAPAVPRLVPPDMLLVDDKFHKQFPRATAPLRNWELFRPLVRGVSPFPHRLPVPGHRVCPPWQPPGLPAQEPRAGDRPGLRHRQQHRLHAVLPAAAPLCRRCGPGHGLPEPKTGLSRGTLLGTSFLGNAL